MRYSTAENIRDGASVIELPDTSLEGVVVAETLTLEDAQMIAHALHAWRLRQQLNVVTICGSMRFYDEMREEAIKHTVAGSVVLMPHGLKDHVDDETKRALDELHLRKIDLADAIFVVNPGGYVGESTRREIVYAHGIGKEIMSTEPLHRSLD